MPTSRLLSAAIGLLSAAALLAAQVSAQDAAPDTTSSSRSQAEPLDEIEVRGRRLSDIEFNLHRHILDFVLEITLPPQGRGYARWQRSVCVGVHNLEASAAQYLVDRISWLAMEVGLAPGEPGCSPDVLIVFTTDANGAATYMVENQPLLFRPAGGRGGVNLDLAALDEFKQSDRPVRWWHVSLPVDARTGAPAIRLPGHDWAPIIAVAGPSRIYSGIRDDLQRAIIVVDATRLSGKTWQQIGDYLAVVSLAQIDPNASPAAFDSILNLFETPQFYSGLTDWDLSYVRALYAFDQERLPQLQRGALVSQMVRQEREAADAAE